MIRSVVPTCILSILLLVSVSPAHATSNQSELINFNYLQTLQSVGSFYDGGLTNVPNYGVSFNNFWGLRNTSSFGFSADPTGTPIVFVNSGSPMTSSGNPQVTGTMTVAGGFTTGLNFFYAGLAQGQSETVTVWSGANGTGTILATLRLYSNSGSCSGAVTYCLWTSVSTPFSGTARSVTFTGPADEMGISDMTLGSTHTAIPEPSSLYLLGTGILGVGTGKLRRLFGF